MGQGTTGPSTTRRRFTKEFKIEAVRLSRQPGMTAARAAADLGVPQPTLHRWRKELAEAEAGSGEGRNDAFRGHGRRTAAQEELARLRRENAELRMERDILKKAAAWFAKQQL
jgi:transposase